MEIARADRVVRDLVAEVVALAVDDAALLSPPDIHREQPEWLLLGMSNEVPGIRPCGKFALPFGCIVGQPELGRMGPISRPSSRDPGAFGMGCNPEFGRQEEFPLTNAETWEQLAPAKHIR